MNILVVDDEPHARRSIKEALAELGIKKVREASSIDQALKAIIADRPDVLLLDIEMKGGTKGFDLLGKVPTRGIPVIFITAYKEHAAQAFRVRAEDYLLKPVDKNQLQEVLGRIVERSMEKHPRLGADDKVLFRENSKKHYIRVGDIQIMESVGAYTKLILTNERIIINGTLGKVLKRFDTSIFFRANRKTAVNLRDVTKVSEIKGQVILSIANQPPVECSRRHSIEFREMREI